MLIINLGLLVAAILVVAFVFAPGVRAGTANPTAVAAAVAAIVGFGPVLFAVTGVTRWDWWFVVLFASLFFGLAFLGGRVMAPGMLEEAHRRTPGSSPDPGVRPDAARRGTTSDGDTREAE